MLHHIHIHIRTCLVSLSSSCPHYKRYDAFTLVPITGHSRTDICRFPPHAQLMLIFQPRALFTPRVLTTLNSTSRAACVRNGPNLGLSHFTTSNTDVPHGRLPTHAHAHALVHPHSRLMGDCLLARMCTRICTCTHTLPHILSLAELRVRPLVAVLFLFCSLARFF